MGFSMCIMPQASFNGKLLLDSDARMRFVNYFGATSAKRLR
jgi:hypothetical protein